ncbi:hypothetical protein DNU06_16775 [Putridiphycobacter roseus]|uniref:Fibronectin type-III domain-containing protein n=1 Tax=Putridiphycobacter roseus TaxID=2219161 RepID=A0A2W1MUF8_9FLAO|nr:fibronectin type III domain-containing protein [Putridiphycobacter roseus]PZE15699.1 hypothetical protein DNU06_16775 [Putridiphycobacter roseus]
MKKIYFILNMLFLGVTTAFAQGETCATAVSVNAGTYVSNGAATGGGASTQGTNADWYSFTPVCDGVMSVGSCGGGVDTQLYLHSGACGALTQVGFADDNCTMGPGQSGYASEVANLNVTGGTTYYIEWTDYWSSAATPWFLEFTIGGGVQNVVNVPSINSSDISWSAAGAETSWDIQWGPSGFSLGAAFSATVTDPTQVNTFYTMTNLMPETTYDVYIAVGGSGCFVGPLSITTLPLCPVPTNLASSPLTNSAILTWDLGNVETSWDLQYGPAGTPIGDAGMDFNNTVNAAANNALNIASCTDYHWYVRAICTNYTPTLYSAWVGPVSFSTDCVCPDPSNLTASEDPNSPFNYILEWDDNGSGPQWNVQYGATGFPFGSGTIVTANSNPYLLTGLIPGTEYDYYVQGNCGSTADSMSQWIGPFTFTTPIYCEAPTALSVSNITTSQASINWTSPNASSWTIEWGAAGFTQGNGTTSTINSNNATLTGLTPATDYCYYVKANCGATIDLMSNWAGPYCFTSLASCPAPSNLNVANISVTSATLTWQIGGSETAWDIEWGFPGFTPFTGQEEGSASVTNAIPSYYVTGLNSSAPYEFYVSAACGGTDGNSSWTGPFQFTTILENDLPCGAVELLVDGVVNVHTNANSSYTESAIAPPFAFAYGNNWYNSATGTSYPLKTVWFKFKAPASGKVEISTVNSVTQTNDRQTQLALYTVGLCSNYGTYNFVEANTFHTNTYRPAIRGSKILSCELNPGQYYYVMASHWGNSTGTTGSQPGTFGISVTDLPDSYSGTATPITICGDGSDIDLFSTIDGYSSTTGTWYNPSISNPGFTTPGSASVISLPTGAGTYTFDYVIANACGADTVSTSISSVAPSSAGMDGAFTTCNTDDVVLISHLNGFVDLGGQWTDVNGLFNVSNGIFNSYGAQYGTYTFEYTVGSGNGCDPDTSYVSITLTDNCLGLDGDAAVSNLEVYPNPVVDVMTIANLNIEGPASLNIYDAQGKIVLQSDISNYYGNLTVDMTKLESGMYTLEINAETAVEKHRVVKQ